MMTDIDEQAAGFLRSRGIEEPLDAAIILGTGLGKLAETLEGAVSIPFEEIPGFPEVQVSGHSGRVVFGRIEGRRVLILQGRAHYYETGDPAAMRVPIAAIARLQPRLLLITNAAGSLKSDMKPGNLVVIRDHINYSGMNPLIGDRGDGRFVSMTDAYDETTRHRLKRCAMRAGAHMHDGVYMWFSGPSFETPAEVRMAKLLGADLVGMSTVPEVILARRHGLKVAALSIITNLASGIEGAVPTHKDTRDMAMAATLMLERVIRRFLSEFDYA